MRAPASPPPEATARPGVRLTAQRVLAVVLAVEVADSSLLCTNFLSADNGFKIVRASVQIGVLALPLAPAIANRGIDLSVGSLLGLSGVVFGLLWRDGVDLTKWVNLTEWGLPPMRTGPLPLPAAGLAALVMGAGAGGLNALLITRLRLPPLIVTLGTFSLFRGLAEGLTRGVDNFTGFPDAFLFLGQGDFLGGIPA